VPLGVYVHIPFCSHRCDYCDFATWTDRAHLVDRYLDACLLHLRRLDAAGLLAPATSVFFGGGTPSLVDGERLAGVLTAIPLTPGAEVTVECNPDSIDAAKLACYADAGVNRVSIGVQSMDPSVLRALNRTHDPDNVVRAVDATRRAGIGHLNLDLIYGTPGESRKSWAATVRGAVALEPDHVSAYALTVEPATPLGRAVAHGTSRRPDDDDQADKYVLADELLGAHGFEWYEISNWSRAGGECMHNRLYWSGGDYLAIGCAAHGALGGRRFWNVRSPERYIAAVEEGGDPEAGSEQLAPAERADEHFALALRTRDGARVPAGAERIARQLADGEMVELRDERIVLTRAGRLMASDVTNRLLLAAERREHPRPEVALGTIEC
jgi:oxygen-independent coproporphyrinogen-3 oxidase